MLAMIDFQLRDDSFAGACEYGDGQLGKQSSDSADLPGLSVPDRHEQFQGLIQSGNTPGAAETPW